MNEPTRFQLELTAGADALNRDPSARLRGALKLLARGFGFRCTSLRALASVADEEAISREIADPDEAQAAEQQERSTRHSPPSGSKVAHRCTAHDEKELIETTTITEKELAPSCTCVYDGARSEG